MIRPVASVLTALTLLLSAAAAIAGPFRNLDFEEADVSNLPPSQYQVPTTAAFPHWTVSTLHAPSCISLCTRLTGG
jgi:hypothetical protein